MKKNIMHMLVIFALLFPAVFSSRIPGFAQNTEEFPRAQRGFYIGAFYTGISTPTFRMASGGEELAVPQSSSTPGFMAGYQYDLGKFGFGARILYWHTSFKNFGAPEMPGSPTYVSYADPAFTHISFDLIIEWVCVQTLRVGLYGFLGMGSSTESYTISGSVFPEWNGQKSLSEFDYSYGLGAKFSPIKLISIIAEIRWMPGDRTTDLEYLYTKGGYDYFKVGDSYTTNFTTFASAGLSFHF
jgi:Outer membrane protein beta-barrel domain